MFVFKWFFFFHLLEEDRWHRPPPKLVPLERACWCFRALEGQQEAWPGPPPQEQVQEVKGWWERMFLFPLFLFPILLLLLFLLLHLLLFLSAQGEGWVEKCGALGRSACCLMGHFCPYLVA